MTQPNGYAPSPYGQNTADQQSQQNFGQPVNNGAPMNGTPTNGMPTNGQPQPNPAFTNEPPLDQPWYGINMAQAVVRYFKKYIVFTGRASRGEYWWWVLANAIITFVLNMLSQASNGDLRFLVSLWGLATLVPTLAVSVRRLHDTNRSGWWLAGIYGAMFISIIMMAAGGGYAIFTAFSSYSNYYGASSMTGGGIVLMFLGVLVLLAAAIVSIVLMASRSDARGTRFDKNAQQYGQPVQPVQPVQSPYSQPQYNQSEYGQPQYNQTQYDQSQYGQPSSSSESTYTAPQTNTSTDTAPSDTSSES